MSLACPRRSASARSKQRLGVWLCLAGEISLIAVGERVDASIPMISRQLTRPSAHGSKFPAQVERSTGTPQTPQTRYGEFYNTIGRL